MRMLMLRKDFVVVLPVMKIGNCRQLCLFVSVSRVQCRLPTDVNAQNQANTTTDYTHFHAFQVHSYIIHSMPKHNNRDKWCMHAMPIQLPDMPTR